MITLYFEVFIQALTSASKAELVLDLHPETLTYETCGMVWDTQCVCVWMMAGLTSLTWPSLIGILGWVRFTLSHQCQQSPHTSFLTNLYGKPIFQLWRGPVEDTYVACSMDLVTHMQLLDEVYTWWSSSVWKYVSMFNFMVYNIHLISPFSLSRLSSCIRLQLLLWNLNWGRFTKF